MIRLVLVVVIGARLFSTSLVAAQTTDNAHRAPYQASSNDLNAVIDTFVQWESAPVALVDSNSAGENPPYLRRISVEGETRRQQALQSLWQQVEGISVSNLSDMDQETLDLLKYRLELWRLYYQERRYLMPFNGDNDPLLFLFDVRMSVDIHSLESFDEYMKLLADIPAYIESLVSLLEQGRKEGFMPCEFALSKLPIRLHQLRAADAINSQTIPATAKATPGMSLMTRLCI